MLVRIPLPPPHELDELLAHFAADGAAGEEVLGTIGLGGLRQDRRAAVADDQIARHTEGRVGGHAGIAIRATALQRDLEVASRHGLAVTSFDSASTSRTKASPASTVLRVPPMLWMSMLRMRPASFCSRSISPIWFTSQPRPSTMT